MNRNLLAHSSGKSKIRGLASGKDLLTASPYSRKARLSKRESKREPKCYSYKEPTPKIIALIAHPLLAEVKHLESDNK